MPSESDSFLPNVLGSFVGSAVTLTIGTLLIVVSIRDFLLYLDHYDLGMVGTTGGLFQLVILSGIGWLFTVVGILYPTYLTVAKATS